MSITAQDFPEIRWKGHWIRVPEDQILFSMGLPGSGHPSDPRWAQFLAGGYDTIGECWAWGTHVHAGHDLLYAGRKTCRAGLFQGSHCAVSRSAHLGQGSVPSPHGLISVEATQDSLTFDSPVPTVIIFAGLPTRELLPGHHRVSARTA